MKAISVLWRRRRFDALQTNCLRPRRQATYDSKDPRRHLTIVFNGRMFNADEIKQKLKGLGYLFEGYRCRSGFDGICGMERKVL